MYKSQRGEIVTIIAIASVIILGVATAISSTFIGKNNQTTSTRAAGMTCEANVCPILNSAKEIVGCGQQCSNLNNCDINGGCNSACCKLDSDCPGGQKCQVPYNGYCQSNNSCDPGTGGETTPTPPVDDPCGAKGGTPYNECCGQDKERHVCKVGGNYYCDDGSGTFNSMCDTDQGANGWSCRFNNNSCEGPTRAPTATPYVQPTATKTPNTPTATPPTTCTQKSTCGGGCASGYYCDSLYRCVKDSDCGAATPTPPKTCTQKSTCGGGCASGYYCDSLYRCVKDSDCDAEPTIPPGGATCSTAGAACSSRYEYSELRSDGLYKRTCTFTKCSPIPTYKCSELPTECTDWVKSGSSGTTTCTVPGTQTTFKDKICTTIKGISNAYTCKNGQIGDEQSCVLGCNLITNECKKTSDTGSTSSTAKHITVKGKVTNKGTGGVNDLLVNIGVIAANGKPAANLAPISPFDTQLYGDGSYSFDFNVTNPESLPPTPSCILVITTTSNVKVADMNVPCPLNQTTQKDFEIAYPAVIDHCDPDRCAAPNEAITLWSKCTNSSTDGSCLRKSFFKSQSDCGGNANELNPAITDAPAGLPYYCSSTKRVVNVKVQVEVPDKSKIADFNPQTKPWVNFRENGDWYLNNLAYASVDNFTDHFEVPFSVEVKDIKNAVGNAKTYFTEFCYWPLGLINIPKCYNNVKPQQYPGGQEPNLVFKIVVN